MNDQWILPNGLRVIGERLPYLRSVSIGVWLHAGSMMEQPEENGLSHFLEHMVFKGTEHRTTRQIAEEMDAVGGQLNAFTGKDCTCFYAKVIDENLDLAVDLLSDLTIHATIDPQELAKERGVVLEEIAMDEDSPEDLVTDLLSGTQYTGMSLGMPILGTTGLVSAYTRDSLIAYRAKRYAPKETVVALCGNYDPTRVQELVTRYFGEWHNEAAPLMLPEMKPITGRCALREKDTEQMHICVGFPGTGYGQDEIYPQAVLNTVLGGSMSSRLFQRVREELGMAYTVYSYPNSYQGSGTFGVYAGVSPKNGQLVLEEMLAVIRRLVDEGMTEKEFRDAKTQLRGGYLLGLESPGGRMQAMGRELLLLGTEYTPEKNLAKIEAVTMDSVMAAARRILTADPCLAVVGKGAEKIHL